MAFSCFSALGMLFSAGVIVVPASGLHRLDALTEIHRQHMTAKEPPRHVFDFEYDTPSLSEQQLLKERFLVEDLALYERAKQRFWADTAALERALQSTLGDDVTLCGAPLTDSPGERHPHLAQAVLNASHEAMFYDDRRWRPAARAMVAVDFDGLEAQDESEEVELELSELGSGSGDLLAQQPRSTIGPSSNPPFLMHMHIAKTGGHAVHDWLLRNTELLHGYDFCATSKSGPPWGQEHLDLFMAQYETGLLSARKSSELPCNLWSYEFGLLSRSGTAAPLHEMLNTLLDHNLDVQLTTTLREPMSELLSQYHHNARNGKCGGERYKDAANPIFEELNNNDGKCDDHTSYQVESFQTHFFAPSEGSAADVMDRLFHVGLKEYMDASMCLLSYQLRRFDYENCVCHREA